MQTSIKIYEKVRKLNEKGRDVKSCCRSVAYKLGVDEGVVEVIAAERNEKWYNELGFNVREKI